VIQIEQRPGEDRVRALQRFCVEHDTTLAALAGETITFVPSEGVPRQDLPPDSRGWRSVSTPLPGGYRRRREGWSDDEPLLPDLGTI
jgi:hypothetical protein